MKSCPECSLAFTPTDRRQRFCTGPHQTAFHDLMARRGKVLLPFALVSRSGKSGYKDVHRYSLRNFNALLDRWNAEDKAAGRNPALVVQVKMDALWSAADLSPRR